MLYWPIAGGHLATSFNEQLDRHGTWRREFALRLKLLAEWMNDQVVVVHPFGQPFQAQRKLAPPCAVSIKLFIE